VADAEPGAGRASGLYDQALSKHHVLRQQLLDDGIGSDERDEPAKRRVEDLNEHRRILRRGSSEYRIEFPTRTGGGWSLVLWVTDNVAPGVAVAIAVATAKLVDS